MAGLSSQDLQDAELGRIPSLALLEEAKLWSAVLLRLSRRFRVWAHVPQLAQVRGHRHGICTCACRQRCICESQKGNRCLGA